MQAGGQLGVRTSLVVGAPCLGYFTLEPIAMEEDALGTSAATIEQDALQFSERLFGLLVGGLDVINDPLEVQMAIHVPTSKSFVTAMFLTWLGDLTCPSVS